MGQFDFANSEASDLSNTMTSYSVDAEQTDGATDQKETKWDNEKFSQYFELDCEEAEEKLKELFKISLRDSGVEVK